MFDSILFRRLVAVTALCLLPAGVAIGADDAVVQDNLYGTSFVDARTGWACGAFGTIAHTADGGTTWQLQSSGSLEQLFSIDFVNPRLGWAVGRLGTVVHTADGGATWKRQKSPSDKHLFSVDFINDTHGLAVGDWGVIIATEDGGATWQERSLSEDVILNSVSMISPTSAVAAAEIGMLFRTDDGGRTWNKLTSGVDKTLFGVRCIDANRCWAVGIDALLLRTVDGGANWQVLNGSVEMRALEQVGFGQAFENPSLYGIDVSGNFGVAVGELGSVFVSRDAGVTWKRLEASKNWALPWFRDLTLVDDQVGAMVGARGRRIIIEGGKIEFDAEVD